LAQWFIDFFIFLLPTHKITDIFSKPLWYHYLIDILGRIFVGYGIYQTVAAFRKST